MMGMTSIWLRISMRDNRNPPLASPFSRGSAIRSANRFHCRSNIFVLESFLYIINVQIHRQVPKSIPGKIWKNTPKNVER